VPGNMALRSDAAMRHLGNITPGLPGTLAGRKEKTLPKGKLSPAEKARIKQLVQGAR
jgi:hypothetical protein